MTTRSRLLRHLADGAPHETQALARETGLTPHALEVELLTLADWGLAIEAVGDRGYRLVAPIELIDRDTLDASLACNSRARLDGLELYDELDSTNARLLSGARPTSGRARVALAEFQSAGRGRRGRTWLQPCGSGLCLSLAWCFAKAPADLGALSLAAGVATLRALERFRIPDLALKWPNDVLRHGHKLGGILAELRLAANGSAHVVVGVGLNVRLPAATATAIAAAQGLPPADLADRLPSRTLLAAALIDELIAMLIEFEAHGFAAFAVAWSAADALRGRRVRVDDGAHSRDGIARGVGADGALRVEIEDRIETVASGEVTLRRVA